MIKEVPLNRLHTAIYTGIMFVYIDAYEPYAKTEAYLSDGATYGQVCVDNPEEFENELQEHIDWTINRYPEINIILKFYKTVYET